MLSSAGHVDSGMNGSKKVFNDIADSKEEDENGVNSGVGLSTRAIAAKESICAGREIEAVLITTDGELTQITYDTTPSTKHANRLLHSRPTIVGEFESINVIIARGISSTGDVNRHVLPYPFCNKLFNGNYLLYRVSTSGQPTSFTIDEYRAFVRKNQGKTHDAMRNESEQNDSRSNQEMPIDLLKNQIENIVSDEFRRKMNREPNAEELKESIKRTLSIFVDSMVANEDESGDYNPDDITETEIDNVDENDDDMPADVRIELDNVIYDIKKLAVLSRQDILDRVRDKYLEETGDEISEEDLIIAFNNVADKLLPNENNMADINVSMTSVEFSKLMSEALEYSRAMGRIDGERLADTISATFYEINGIDPSLDDLTNIFRKMRNELEMEAQEELLEDNEDERRDIEDEKEVDRKDEEEEDEIIDDGSAIALARMLGDLNVVNPNNLVQYAYRVVRQDLKANARAQFEIVKGRSPNRDELIECMTELANQKFSPNENNNREELNADDADYNPINATDINLEERDNVEDERYEERMNVVNGDMYQTKITKSRLGSVAYEVQLSENNDTLDEFRFEQARKWFEKFNGRQPNDDEIENLEQFMQHEKAKEKIEC